MRSRKDPQTQETTLPDGEGSTALPIAFFGGSTAMPGAGLPGHAEVRRPMATKYIFFTGGVVSSVGKGVTAAATGLILKERGFKVAVQKLDPYINVDPGTMSPYQHGEVFVLDDGAETDLDLGHYERFIDIRLTRVSNFIEESNIAMRRYLETCHLWTPDPVINRGVQWAKINQLRDQQEYQWGDGFSNNPPSDIVVGRDSVWYLAGSSYYAQPWSRKLFDFWFRYGLEVSGKFTEYLTASGNPLFKDDYGLNINDNTPLFLIAAHQYYSVTGDLGFLHSVYLRLLQSANYILEQRKAGLNNHYGLVWSTSTETFVRGLCGWRNAIPNYTLSGAVTEVNVECYRALRMTAELAKAMGDEPNRERFESGCRGTGGGNRKIFAF